MDFIRTRAVPALILAAGLGAGAASGADCGKLQGRYHTAPAATVGDLPLDLTRLAQGPNRAKLSRMERGSNPSGLGGGGVMQRPKVILLGVTAQLRHTPQGASLEFFDTQGKSLAVTPIEMAARWKCRNGRLERSYDAQAGLGNAIVTQRTEESIERDAAGDLVVREKVTLVAKNAPPAKVREWRYSAVR